MPTLSAPTAPFGVAAPTHRPLAVPVLHRLAWAALAAGAIVLLSLFARQGGGPATPSAPREASSTGFTPSDAALARPALPLALTAPRFHLDDPEALEPVRAEPARRNPVTGQREDVLTQGDFASIEGPYLRLTLTETPGFEAGQSLFVTLARRAADERGLAVIRTSERGTLATKFGPIETLDITLGGEGKRICTGFTSLASGLLRLDGWLCAPLGQAPTPRATACTLDRIALNGQAWPDGERAFAAFDARSDPACRPRVVTAREGASETGSIPNPRTRKNEAKLRPSREARP